MDVDVELGGLPDLVARLDHAQAGLLELTTQLALELEQDTPPMMVADSPAMRPRTWGTGDVWTLPAGGWIVGQVRLPDPLEPLATHVQQLLDGH